MLLDPFEKQLHLPTRLVERADCRGRQSEIVGHKYQRFSGLGILESNAAQMFGIVLAAGGADERDGLIANDTRIAVHGWLRVGYPRNSSGTPFCHSNRHHPLSPGIPRHSWLSALPPLVLPDTSDWVLICAELSVSAIILKKAVGIVARALKMLEMEDFFR